MDIFNKHILELAERSYGNGIYNYTAFLSEAELSEFLKIKKEITGIPYEIFGGFDECDRNMVGFGSEELCGYKGEFPICIVRISPKSEKFADELSHRDFLGSLMQLGIERQEIGDIRIKNNVAYVAVTDKMAGVVAEELDKVKHTYVSCKILDKEELATIADLRVNYVEKQLQVASERLDCIVAKFINESRGNAQNLITAGKIFVNGTETISTSLTLKEGDKVSVRGYGKFIFDGCRGKTRKENLIVSVRIYS